jgi:hypothetical protein
MKITYSSLLGFQIQCSESDLSDLDTKSLLFTLVQQAPVPVLKQLRAELDKIIPALEIDYDIKS